MPHAQRRRNRSSRRNAPRRSAGPARSLARSFHNENVVSDAVLARGSDTSVALRVCKTINKGLVAGSTSAPAFYAYYFTLNDLNESSSFTNLFDQYRITKIQCVFIPLNLMQTAGTTSVTNSPMCIVVDYDDASTPASMVVLYNYQNVRFVGCQTRHVFAFKPRIALASYSGSFTSYANVGNTWIDCSSPSVQHYAVKIGVDQCSQVPNWVFYARYFIEFRNIR